MLQEFIDPWFRYLYLDFSPLERADIAWSDFEALTKYPSHNWVYDRALLAEMLGQKVFRTPESLPDEFFVKPRVNLWGMGERALKNEIWDPEQNDMVGFPLYEGEHLSFDIWADTVVCFKGHKRRGYGFSHWERVARQPPRGVQDLRGLLGGYRGVLNVETIGGMVIEAHLRPSLQFASGTNFLGHVLRGEKLKGGAWFSHVVHVQEDFRPKIPPGLRVPEGAELVCCWDQGHWLGSEAQPEGSYVLAFINGEDLSKLEKFGKILSRRVLRRKTEK